MSCGVTFARDGKNPASFRIMKLVLIASLVFTSFAFAQWSAAERDALLRRMDAQAAHFGDLSKQIWGFAEVGYQETRSAALLRDELKNAGFTITDRVADIPTAFSAQWGNGHPVIGILGEYDALPGLEQERIGFGLVERAVE